DCETLRQARLIVMGPMSHDRKNDPEISIETSNLYGDLWTAAEPRIAPPNEPPLEPANVSIGRMVRLTKAPPRLRRTCPRLGIEYGEHLFHSKSKLGRYGILWRTAVNRFSHLRWGTAGLDESPRERYRVR